MAIFQPSTIVGITGEDVFLVPPQGPGTISSPYVKVPPMAAAPSPVSGGPPVLPVAGGPVAYPPAAPGTLPSTDVPGTYTGTGPPPNTNPCASTIGHPFAPITPSCWLPSVQPLLKSAGIYAFLGLLVLIGVGMLLAPAAVTVAEDTLKHEQARVKRAKKPLLP